MKPRIFSVLLACSICLLLFSTAILADEKLFTAKYSSHYSGMSVAIIRTLTQRNDGTYEYKFDAESRLVDVNEKSIFSLVDNVIVPRHYSYNRKIFGISKQESVQFNWEKNIATYSADKSKIRASHPLTAQVLDSSLYQLQLQKDLYNGVEKLRYTYIQRESLREREFVVIGEVPFTLQGTTYKALKLERAGGDSDKRTQVIVIPELMYIIAHIKQIKDGQEYETKLTDLTLNSARLAKLYTGTSNSTTH